MLKYILAFLSWAVVVQHFLSIYGYVPTDVCALRYICVATHILQVVRSSSRQMMDDDSPGWKFGHHSYHCLHACLRYVANQKRAEGQQGIDEQPGGFLHEHSIQSRKRLPGGIILQRRADSARAPLIFHVRSQYTGSRLAQSWQHYVRSKYHNALLQLLHGQLGRKRDAAAAAAAAAFSSK